MTAARRSAGFGKVAAAVALGLAAGVHAQTGVLVDAGQTTLYAGTGLVLVPALVGSREGGAEPALTAEDFVLTDSGVRQTVRLESEAAGAPLSLVVLMQTGGSARGQFATYRGLSTMLAELLDGTPDRVRDGAANRVAIVNFDSRVEAASPFTTEVLEWRDAIDQPDQGDSGAAIYDGIAYALKLLREEPRGNRRMILLISQERDDGSKLSAKEIVEDAGESNTTIYSLTFSAERTELRQAFIDKPHLNPPIVVNPSAGATQGYFSLSGPLALAIGAMRRNVSAELAELSGGVSSRFNNRKELEAGLKAMTDQERGAYLLSFAPSSNRGGLHTIGVEIAGRPELRVRARRTYWSDAAVETPATAPRR